MSIEDKIKNAKESHLFDELSEKEKFEAIVEAKVKVRLIAEFEEIKEEITNIQIETCAISKTAKDIRYEALWILDNHISKLKGG